MATKINKPAGQFLVVAQLTEETSPGHGMGMRYFVKAGYDSPLDMGKGTFADNIEQARNRIHADIQTMSRTTDASGLIDWGKMAAREYAIFPITIGDQIE